MRNIKYIKKVSEIEELVILDLNLLEIANIYCDYNFDKSKECANIGAILKIIINNHNILADKLDQLV